MSQRDDPPTPETPAERQQSVANPFVERDEADEEPPQINLSKKRAAVMGAGFGLSLALLAFVCVALSFAISTCTA